MRRRPLSWKGITYSSDATKRGALACNIPNKPQSVGDVACYTLTPDGLFACLHLPYRPEYFAQPNPFSVPEDRWEELDADHQNGMTYPAIAAKWGIREQTVFKTLKRYREREVSMYSSLVSTAHETAPLHT